MTHRLYILTEKETFRGDLKDTECVSDHATMHLDTDSINIHNRLCEQFFLGLKGDHV